MMRVEEKSRFQSRFFIILARPENPENIGLVARAMKNTGFENLRLVGLKRLRRKAHAAAVHADNILTKASFHRDLARATGDLNVVFAATAKKRKNFSSLSLEAATARMFSFPLPAKIGLLFGNERTGLTSEELRFSNFRLTIPQACRQPSYNLAAAVLITLFEIFRRLPEEGKLLGLSSRGKPLSGKEQEQCIRLILKSLEAKKFVHATNKRHVEEKIHDLLGRLTITAKDKALLLALFSHAGENPGTRPE